MLKRPKPKTLSPESMATLNQASAAQTGAMNKLRSYDPDYPVFEIPINQRVLVYVPNHTEIDPDGAVSLRMDKFAAHAVIDGRNFDDIRCTSGIVLPELGLDGTCPLCNAMSEVWDLYGKEYSSIAKSKGIDPQSPEAQEGLKEERKNLVRNMVLKNADVWYTFPIVVIDCLEKDGKLTITPKKDATGRISGKPMWYSIRERTYIDKWIPAFDALSDGEGIESVEVPTTPAGMWAVLNFTYTPKSGKHDRMGSAKNLSVTFKTNMTGYDEWAEYFDKLTEGWNAEKAMNTLVLDALRDMEEMNQVCDHLMKPVRDKLALYNITGSLAEVSAPAENTLAEFGGTPVIPKAEGATPPSGDITGEMPNTGIE